MITGGNLCFAGVEMKGYNFISGVGIFELGF